MKELWGFIGEGFFFILATPLFCFLEKKLEENFEMFYKAIYFSDAQKYK